MAPESSTKKSEVDVLIRLPRWGGAKECFSQRIPRDAAGGCLGSPHQVLSSATLVAQASRLRTT